MAKRGQGEGSISKRPDGTWWARITVGKTPDGKQKRKAFYGKTRKEVQEKLTAALNDINNNTYIEPSKMTVEQWMYIWLRDYKKASVKPKTYAAYEAHVRNHIAPDLGNYTLATLRNDMVQRFVNGLADKGLKSLTIERIVGTLKTALIQAVDNDLIAKSPATRIKMPLKQERTPRVLTVEEQNIFMEYSKEHRNGEIFLLILGTGLRIGDDDDKIRLNQRKPSKYKGLSRFGPEKNLQRINKFMKERPTFYKKLIQMKENFRFYLRCFYCITKVVILQFNSEKQDRISS